MPTPSQDAEGYAAGRRAASQELALTAENAVDRASKALLTYLRTRGLSLLDSAPEVVMPIAEAFSDGFLDEVMKGPPGPDGGAGRESAPDSRSGSSAKAQWGPDEETFPGAHARRLRIHRAA